MGPVLSVCLPNTEITEPSKAVAIGKTTGEPFGFPVALQDGHTVAFRHVFNKFERWMQGCMEEQLAELFCARITYDATGETFTPGTIRYRCRRTFRGYLAHGLHKPLTEDDKTFINRHQKLVPEGWW